MKNGSIASIKLQALDGRGVVVALGEYLGFHEKDIFDYLDDACNFEEAETGCSPERAHDPPMNNEPGDTEVFALSFWLGGIEPMGITTAGTNGLLEASHKS